MTSPFPTGATHASLHDTEARYSTKRSVTWVGNKVHLTETGDADWPNLITHVETAVATEDDLVAVSQVLQALAQRDLLPKEHLVDTYGSGETLLTSQTEYSVDLVCPVPPILAGKLRMRTPSRSLSSPSIGRLTA